MTATITYLHDRLSQMRAPTTRNLDLTSLAF
jgi:hypothetical protein